MLFFWRINQPKTRRFIIGLFLDATLYLLKRVRLSVRPSVHPYVRPSIRVCPSVRRPPSIRSLAQRQNRQNCKNLCSTLAATNVFTYGCHSGWFWLVILTNGTVWRPATSSFCIISGIDSTYWLVAARRGPGETLEFQAEGRTINVSIPFWSRCNRMARDLQSWNRLWNRALTRRPRRFFASHN